MKTAFKNSVLFRGSDVLERSAKHAKSTAMWETFVGKSDAAVRSRYFVFFLALQSLLKQAGDAARASVVGRCFPKCKDGALGIFSDSRLLGRVCTVPLRRWLLVLFALYLPMEYAIRNVLGFGRLASAWEELFILFAALVAMVHAAKPKTNAFAQVSATEAALLLFMGVGLLLMMLNRPNPGVALLGYRAQVQYMIWFFLVIRLLEDRKDAAVLYGVFASTVLAMCLHGIYQYIVGVDIPAHWVTQTEMGVRTRVFSLTGSPNILGSLIVMAAPMMAACLYYARSIAGKVLAFLATGAACLCILFTFSRGAWVGLIVAVILFSLFVDKRLLLVMSAAVAGILAAVPSITSRLTYLFTSDYAEASAIGGRALRWQLGRDLLYEHSPVLGFGLGRFGGAVAMNHQLLEETETFQYFYMDNYYLKTLVEMGYLGLFFFLFLLFVFFVGGLRSIHRSGKAHRPLSNGDALFRNAGNPRMLSAGIFSGLVGVLAHCYFENIFEEPYMMAYFWGLAALLTFLGFDRAFVDDLSSEHRHDDGSVPDVVGVD